MEFFGGRYIPMAQSVSQYSEHLEVLVVSKQVHRSVEQLLEVSRHDGDLLVRPVGALDSALSRGAPRLALFPAEEVRSDLDRRIC